MKNKAQSRYHKAIKEKLLEKYTHIYDQTELKKFTDSEYLEFYKKFSNTFEGSILCLGVSFKLLFEDLKDLYLK